MTTLPAASSCCAPRARTSARARNSAPTPTSSTRPRTSTRTRCACSRRASPSSPRSRVRRWAVGSVSPWPPTSASRSTGDALPLQLRRGSGSTRGSARASRCRRSSASSARSSSLYTGGQVKGDEAFRIGLADRVRAARRAARRGARVRGRDRRVGPARRRSRSRRPCAAVSPTEIRAVTAREHEAQQALRAHRRLRARACAPRPSAVRPSSPAARRGRRDSPGGRRPRRARRRGRRGRAAADGRRRSPAPVITGGRSNITVRIVDANGAAYVVRRPPLHSVLPTAHDVGREHRIIARSGPDLSARARRARDVHRHRRARRALLRDGVRRRDRAQRRRHRARRRSTRPRAGRAGDSLVDALVALHAVDPDAVGLGDLAKKDEFVARQLHRWHRQFEQSRQRDLPTVDRVHDVLAAQHPTAA